MHTTTRLCILIVLYALLWIGLRSLNSMLSGASVYIVVDAVFLLFPTLYLRLGEGAIMVLISGFLLGAVRPVEFGQHGLLFLCVYLTMRLWSMRLRREKPKHVLFLAFLANTLLFFGLCFLSDTQWSQQGVIQRTILDFVISTGALFLIAYRTVAWPYLLLYYLGEDPGQRLPVDS